MKARDRQGRDLRLIDRAHARLAGRIRHSPDWQPYEDAAASGSIMRAGRILAGETRLAGSSLTLGRATVWAPAVSPAAEDARQSFVWLDDLAALGDRAARALAQDWTLDWIVRFGRGRGPGWRVDLTGERIIRWLGQGRFLQRDLSDEDRARMARALARQVRFLARRWRRAPAGLPRLTVLAALAEGAAVLGGLAAYQAPALTTLARYCRVVVDEEGAIRSRNPEDLSRILTLLNRVARVAGSAELPPEIAQTRARIAAVLRGLRHADGGLARFHGGGRGRAGLLDTALADSGSRARCDGLAMGYARLAAGRSSVIMDAAPPPLGVPQAHAATLAFELTSGRRPLVVNCGSGAGFGPEWLRAARATASQSVLGLDGYSSARLGPGGDERLSEAPDTVPGESALTATSHRMGAAHNGWQRTHGLMYARTLDLTLDGRALTGEELLIALSDEDQATFARARADTGGAVSFSVRFHLHPEAEAELHPAGDRAGDLVRIGLRSGEIWYLTQDGADAITLQPSVWLEPGRAAPQATLQVVLSGRAMDYATRIRWALAKSPQTPNAIRDLGPEPEADE